MSLEYKDEFEAEIVYNGCINKEEDPADCFDINTIKGERVA